MAALNKARLGKFSNGMKPVGKAICICGTDTGAGKTVVAGLVARYLLDKGYTVVTQKWVETGFKKGMTDIDIHLKFMGKGWSDFEYHRAAMTPYLFRLAASPHLAARMEGVNISVRKIEKCLKMLMRDFDFTIIEGTGGLLVPIDGGLLLIDIVERLGLPVLIVASNKVGAINHTLLTIEGLEIRGIKIMGIIFNDITEGEDASILSDNPKIVEELSGQTVLGRLPKIRNTHRLQKRFTKIGDRIRVDKG